MPWYVLYTKSRNERKVAEKLKERNFEVYCPIIKKERKWSDRIKVVEEPLFRSYCFVKLKEEQRARVFETPGIVRYLFWQNKPAVVREEEIDLIKSMLNEYDDRLIVIEGSVLGKQVKINSGILIDFKGQAIYKQGNILTIFVNTLELLIKVDLTKTLVSV